MIGNIASPYRAIRLVTVLAFAGVLAWGPGSNALAQSEESGGLQGAWRVQVSVVDCVSGTPFPGIPISEVVAFARGGTVSGVTDESLAFQPGQLTSEVGIWKRTGWHTYSSVRDALITFTTAPNPPFRGFSEGTQRFKETIQVDDDRYIGAAVTDFLDLAGNVVSSGCTRSAGQRFK